MIACSPNFSFVPGLTASPLTSSVGVVVRYGISVVVGDGLADVSPDGVAAALLAWPVLAGGVQPTSAIPAIAAMTA
ncbi:hypothetical protein GCM10027598_81710 [Amycolatopsis oliviviridis]|uniref:Uncharacterized protein n=1 Tax=Amycolatopsis oliviviridis TaxID=1471590 RepID=A0ABQ3L641_9PSEU|nr:hypothetical protein GCM10017790_11600 [Amycolatopsis oliviviridis]